MSLMSAAAGNMSNVSATTAAGDTVALYCGERWQALHDGYRPWHGCTALLVCLFGSVANSLNIAVLTRREMYSPTNAILTGLAIADLLVMLEYIPFTLHMYLLSRPPEVRYTYGWAAFVMFHSNFTQVGHSISIWLTVTLAVWRYIAVAHPQHNREWCSMQRTICVILTGYLVCPLICIPVYFSFDITPKVGLVDDAGEFSKSNDSSTPVHNATLYYVSLSELSQANNNLLYDVNFWIYSVVIKIIPCIALTILSLRLVCALMDAKKRRQKLTSSSSRKSVKNLDKERQTDRTTRMLLAVLLLFLITEFPQGILGLLSAVLNKQFFNECYISLGEVMDILALFNSAINFILYCAMSRQFRTTFSILFRPSWMPVPQVEANGHNGHTTTQVTQV
ncbi:hypothetical protein LSTR_LSTR001505 [Laodelphax striatellus]|uniref:G-protein coupled receptors family 1 profile domain-containing protein n=2 Tax=Laodelphax striatellus TaxID=195883 RepID=A0A482XB25_LAOST|nr:hypothetical protein LSTR_LSTR001505 [Laodelphax striatellus]